jgi:hypothetical protein
MEEEKPAKGGAEEPQESIAPEASAMAESTSPSVPAENEPSKVSEERPVEPEYARSKSGLGADWNPDTISEDGEDGDEPEPQQEVLVTLLQAVESGSLEHLRAGIERRADLEESSEVFGDTPL